MYYTLFIYFLGKIKRMGKRRVLIDAKVLKNKD